MKEHDLSQQVCYSFYQVNKLFNQFYMKNLQEFDLTYTQYLSLVVLWKSSPLSLNKLGNELDLASNTLTPLLKRLEEKEYIKRYKPENDKRQLYVELTEKGKNLEHILENKLLSCFRQIDNLNYETSKNFVELNNELANNIKKYLDKK